MLERTGVPTAADIDAIFPSADRLAEGAVAIIECFQRIPCNPCATSCPRGAMQPFDDINDRPAIAEENCNGCTLCITKCPGLAIMILDMTWSEDRALIKLPYEFRPLPEKGEFVTALDREGTPVCEVEVIHVLLNHAMNKVPIVSIAVDKELVRMIRNIRVETPASNMGCRCNDLDMEEIRQYIARGATSIDELKRLTRIGMGPCQGRTCIPIILGELSRTLGKPIAELAPGTYRPVVKSINLGELASYEGGEEGINT